jgi:hypothetical protein
MRTLRRWIKGSIVVLLTSLSLATAVVGIGSRGRVMSLTHNAYSIGPNRMEVLNENEVSVWDGLFRYSHDVTSPPFDGASDYETDKTDFPWRTFFANLKDLGPKDVPSPTRNPSFAFETTPLPHGGHDHSYWFYGLGCGWSYQPRYRDRPAEPDYPEVKGDERAWRKTWDVEASWWYVAILTAVYPCWCFARRLARRFRPAVGFCQACGYDLRASPHQCPECGKLRAVEAQKRGAI